MTLPPAGPELSSAELKIRSSPQHCCPVPSPGEEQVNADVKIRVPTQHCCPVLSPVQEQIIAAPLYCHGPILTPHRDCDFLPVSPVEAQPAAKREEEVVTAVHALLSLNARSAATGDAEAGESRPRVSYVDSIRLNPGAAE